MNDRINQAGVTRRRKPLVYLKGHTWELIGGVLSGIISIGLWVNGVILNVPNSLSFCNMGAAFWIIVLSHWAIYNVIVFLLFSVLNAIALKARWMPSGKRYLIVDSFLIFSIASFIGWLLGIWFLNYVFGSWCRSNSPLFNIM